MWYVQKGEEKKWDTHLIMVLFMTETMWIVQPQPEGHLHPSQEKIVTTHPGHARMCLVVAKEHTVKQKEGDTNI